MNWEKGKDLREKFLPALILALAMTAAVLLPLFSTIPQNLPQTPNLLPGQSKTLLPDGRWLLIGGERLGGFSGAASIWQPGTGSATQLSSTLNRPRAWHTATTLPDGLVLILGGVGNNKQIVTTAELFDPATQSFTNLSSSGVTPRARHTATLLSDGHVLIAGGVGANGQTLQSAELWDALEPSSVNLSTPTIQRRDHGATLLANGRVLLWGGADGAGNALNNGDLFDPATQRFTSVQSFPSSLIPQSSDSPILVASIPLDRSVDIDTDSMISLRFSKPLRVETVNTSTVSLSGPKGLEKIVVVPAENGSLAFLTPESDLLPGSTYSVTVNGAIDRNGLLLPVSGISFSTKGDPGAGQQPPSSSSAPGGLQTTAPTSQPGLTTQSSDDDNFVWTGKLKDGKPHSDWEDLPPLQAPLGVTALAGQVLDLRGLPLANVELEIEGINAPTKSVTTDDTGRFLLTDIEPGRRELIIDGREGRSRPNPQAPGLGPKQNHGVFEYGAEIKEATTNVLPFTIWLPKIDEANAVRISSPTTTEVIITTPKVPGLELRLPLGTVIYDHEYGIVQEVSLTRIPLDRTPFPLARNVEVPVYFTAQPGGGYIHAPNHAGARVIYPNLNKDLPGARYTFWHYDPGRKDWHVYGSGAVTEDGKQVAPDPGYGFYEFTGAMFNGGAGPGTGEPQGNPTKGDPVGPATGLFIHEKTDLVVSDVVPIRLTRTYRPQDTNNRPFGIGSTHPYAIFFQEITGWSSTDLVLATGTRIRYTCIPGNDCSHWTTARLEHTTSGTEFYKSTVEWNGNGWDLKFKDGTVWVIGENAPLQAIHDRYGNSIHLHRTSGQAGNITKIIAYPSGRSMEFTYDTGNRIKTAKDNMNRTVTYDYDGSGRLWKVTDPMNGVTEYTYDSSHRMLTVKDPRGIVFLTNEYTSGRVSKQTMADGSTFLFSYTMGATYATQTDITDQRGNVERLEFNSDGRIIRKTLALGKPEQQVFDYELQPGTNLLLSVTDDLLVSGQRRKTAYTHDAKGNVLTVTRMAQDSNPANHVITTYTYEPTFNQVATITDPLGAGHTTTFTYDSFGNLQTAVDANSNQTSYTYNPQGQPLTVTTPAGTTQFVYEFGDLVSVIDPLGNATNRGLDAIGRLQSMTNPLGLTTSYGYDALNRLRTVADPLNGSPQPTRFDYDPNSNLLSVTDAKSPTAAVTTYTYENMDRLATRTDPLLKSESYQYDLAGNLTLFRDRKLQATTYIYDALNRRTQATYADGSSTSYTYDKGNRLTQINDSIAGLITRGYDGLDRLTSEQTPQGTVGYTYDAASRRATMTVPGQALINYTYDNANRLTQITQGSSIVQFGYDNANRRTSLTLPNGILVEYGYDAASRVTSITYKQNGTTVIGDLTYEYDKAGNRTKIGGSWARSGMPEPLTTTSYDANNRQLTFGDKTLAYDDNGNLQSITDSNGTTLYQWNARNQLVGVSGPTVNASFVYDGAGRREKKTINGSLTEFLYDGVNPVQETSGATVLANILPGLDIDEFLTRTDVVAGVAGNFLADDLGSPIAVTDSSGNVQTEYTYESFGRTIATGAPNSNSYQYTGRENDGTGLYYYRARYYHPALQRFISEDPIGFAGGDINFYAYVGGNPVNYVDPTGEVVVAAVALPYVIPAFAALGKAAAYVGTAALAGYLGSKALNKEKEKEKEKEKCRDRDDDDCVKQFDEDTTWCDHNFRGRKNRACHTWADNNLWRCKKGEPRLPFTL
jgi:RHS repeat-associated protein